MDSLQLLTAKINLKTTLIKFTSSIEEINKRHPERMDLVNSMTESLQDLEHFKSVFMQLEEAYYLECKANLRLQMVISELKHEIDKLNMDNKIKKEGL